MGQLCMYYHHYHYLYGAVKDKCYADKPETIDALKNNIREAIDEIQLHIIDSVLKNWTDRVGYCMASRDSHWFQQDGAKCHTVKAILDVLCPVFQDRRRTDVVWSPRSCDLTPLDYYLRSAVKDKCYADKPQTTDALKHNIREAIDEIQLQIIDNVLKNWTDRVGNYMASRGSHMNEISFHY